MEESNDNISNASYYSHAYTDDEDDKGAAKTTGRPKRGGECEGGTAKFQILNENQNVTYGHTKM
jgi:hypothetical protein